MKKSLSIEEFLETRPDITPEMLEEGRLLVEAKIKGYELQQARKACGMTQKEVAAKMGVSQKRISDLENGSIDVMQVETLRRYITSLGGTKRRHISSVEDSRPACTCATYHMPAPFPRTCRTAPSKEKRMNSCAPPPPSGNGRSCRAGCASIHPLVDRRNALCDDFAFSRYVTSLATPVFVAQIQQSRRKKKATSALPSLNDHAMLYIVRCYIHNIHDTLRRCETYFK